MGLFGTFPCFGLVVLFSTHKFHKISSIPLVPSNQMKFEFKHIENTSGIVPISFPLCATIYVEQYNMCIDVETKNLKYISTNNNTYQIVHLQVAYNTNFQITSTVSMRKIYL